MTTYTVKMRRRRKKTTYEVRDIEVVFDEQRLANIKDKYPHAYPESYVFSNHDLSSLAEEIDDDDFNAVWTASPFGDNIEALEPEDLEVTNDDDPLRTCIEDINATVSDALDGRPLTIEQAISALKAVRNACSEELSRLLNEKDETA